MGSLRRAVQEGDIKTGTVMAGQIAGLIKKRQSCKEIIEELVQETQELLKGEKSGKNSIYIPGTGCAEGGHGKGLL